VSPHVTESKPLSTLKNLRPLLIALLVGIVLEFGLERVISDSSIRQLFGLAAVNILIALSLNIINGMAGQFSIGHAGFLAVGSYSAAVLVAHLEARGIAPTFANSLYVVPLALAFAASLAGLLGLVVGLPSLRLRGDYLAIVTLGFAEIVRLTLGSAPKSLEAEDLGTAFSSGGPLHGISVGIAKLGGSNGYQGPKNGGLPAYAGPFWIVLVVVLAVVVAFRIKYSGWGRALRALREDEIASASVGVDPTGYKVRSFVFAAAGAGLAGGLSATMRDGAGIVQPESFGVQASFDAITMVILGGSGSVTGCILGALIITFSIKAIELLQGTGVMRSLMTTAPWLDLNALRMILYAALLIALVIQKPEGIMGEREFSFARLRAFFQRKAKNA
jgi:branched-chain amino acid transport system permease protein